MHYNTTVRPIHQSQLKYFMPVDLYINGKLMITMERKNSFRKTNITLLFQHRAEVSIEYIQLYLMWNRPGHGHACQLGGNLQSSLIQMLTRTSGHSPLGQLCPVYRLPHSPLGQIITGSSKQSPPILFEDRSAHTSGHSLREGRAGSS